MKDSNFKHVWLEWSSFFPNFGDYVAPYIITKLNSHYIPMSMKFNVNDYGWVNENKKLFSIASILRRLCSNCYIWGSAFLTDHSLPKFEQIDPRTVDCRILRGAKSEQVLLEHGIECSHKYADPGILIPYLFNVNKNNPIIYKYGFCLNENDMKYGSSITDLYGEECCVINMFDDPFIILDKISRCEIIIASALHGLIVSEVMNKDCVLLFNKKSDWTNPFKYRDYFTGTNRRENTFDMSVNIDYIMQKPDLSNNFLPKGCYDFTSLITSFPFEIEDVDILRKIKKYYHDIDVV